MQQTDLCDLVPQLSLGTLGALIARDSKRSEFAPAIAAALKISLHWLLTGEGDRDSIDEETGSAPIGFVHPKHDSVFAIPRFNGSAKGGSGWLAPSHEYVVGSITVTDSWLRRRLPPISSRRNLAVIEAYGDSMEPILQSGDLLLVDTGIHDAKIDGIYILLRNHTNEPELMVKRLQRKFDGSLIIKSENRSYEPEVVSAANVGEVQILGKVVWVWAGREI